MERNLGLRQRLWRPVLIILATMVQPHCQGSPGQNLDAGRQALRRAVSVRVLQQDLQRSQTRGAPSNELLTLCGLKRVLGYALDSRSKDLVILGERDPQLPSLHTEDFVVALRNAWLKYAELRGDTNYYSDPGCSIDPDPGVFQELQRNAEQMSRHASLEKIQAAIKRWESKCREPQQVAVLGIPFNTRFAKTMVDADYHMKSLVNGVDSLPGVGLTSLTDLMLNKVKADLHVDQSPTAGLLLMNRFWFYPGANQYGYDDGAVLLDKCPVILLTEEQYLSHGGRISGKGQVNAMAGEFAESFSRHFGEIAEQRPIYLQLEALFRFFALAKILKREGVDQDVDLNYFLDEFEVPYARVDPTLPGVPCVKEFQGSEVLQFWLPSCGGVSISIAVESADFQKDQSGRLTKLKEAALKQRPSEKALSWDFDG